MSTEPFYPSNGTEGAAFHEGWCFQCDAWDAHPDGCHILGESFIGPVPQWVLDEFGQPLCTAFVPKHGQAPEGRCSKTVDMFGDIMSITPEHPKRVVLSPLTYDVAEAAGIDMTKYIKNQKLNTGA